MNTLIYSRKAYTEDTEFTEVVESTAAEANNQEHHIELIQAHYPDLIVEPYYTYEHGGMMIESHKRCEWDSSADAFVAYENESNLLDKLLAINEDLQGTDYD